MLQWLGPVTYTAPVVNRFYYEAALVDADGVVSILAAYSDNYAGKNTLQPDTYLSYSVDYFGNLSAEPATDTGWMNTNPAPETVPSFDLNYEWRSFEGSTSANDYLTYYDTDNGNNTAIFNTAVVDNAASGSPTVATGPSITVTPVSKTLTDNITAEITGLSSGSTLNNALFEVEGAPSASDVVGYFDIVSDTGSLAVTNGTDGNGNAISGTGFSFSDGKAHVFAVGLWSTTYYAQFVETWNPSTNLADVELIFINGSTGAVSSGWTAPTEMQNITKISFSYVGPAGAGMILLADDKMDGQFSEFVVNDSTGLAAPGGDISKTVNISYTGTVTQDARVVSTGQGNNEFLVDWVDGNGLTVELIDDNLDVLETYNIASANGTALLSPYGDGRFLVSYRIASPPTNPASSVDDYAIIDTRLAAQTFMLTSSTSEVAGTTFNDTFVGGSGNHTLAGGGGSDTLTYAAASSPVTLTVGPGGDGSTGSGANGYGGTDTFSGIHSFVAASSGTNTVTLDGNHTDYSYQDLGGGMLEVADQRAGAPDGVDQFQNFQTFNFTDGSFTPGQLLQSPPPPPPPPPPTQTADMIMRDGNNGDYEIYDLGGNAILAASAMGQVGLEWQIAGLGSFFGTDSSDMLLRDSNTGQFEVYDISNNAITNATSMGQVGMEWSVAGFGDFSSHGGESDMLMRNSNTGILEVYDISNNQITSAAPMGQVGLEWQVSGFGDFSGNANETDMLMRNTNTGVFEVYDISQNQITFAGPMGQVGLEWSVVGFGPINGAGAGDMLMRNSNTGAFELYDITNNQITSAASMGHVGLEWSVAGIAADPPNGATSQLAQSMASFAPAAGLLPASPQIDTPVAPPSAASPLTSTNVQYELA
jgi:hypothetical protein